ncbi:MAG: DEAD/DEAH box helicase [bacterium]|nr:DEAD/DEAH box helicase [bacterium]
MDLAGFIDTYRDAIAQRVVESYPPRYRPSDGGQELPPLLRAPLGAQADAIRGAALSLRAQRGTTVVGEMGTGKTFIAAAAAYTAGFQRSLVICPPHLVRKWKREVEETVPGARAVIVASITDLERLRSLDGAGPLFAVMSRERAKLSYRWRPAVVERWATSGGRLVRDEETGEPFRAPCCPDCHAQVVDRDGVPLTGRDLARRKRRCGECAAPLWQADRTGPKRVPLADYVKQRLKNFFELLIADEVHELKGRGSAQGIAGGVLADACGKSLSLSGTLSGGYSSTLFHLLYRFSPEIRTEFGRHEEQRWIERYGFVEHTVGRDDGDSLEDGRASRRKRYRKVVRERPGLAPAALFHLIGHSVFLRLSDVAAGLPPYEEQVLLSPMDAEPDATGLSQRSAYDEIYGALRAALADALSKGSRRLLATYLQTLLAYPDGCTRGETVFDPESGDVLVQVPPLNEERLYPKERALLDLVAAERLVGRRVLVYVTHTGTRDITGRMEEFLGRHGLKVAVMKADAVPPERREAWVRKRVEEGVDVLVCHPQLVQTGLDLVEFPTVVWFETHYSVYTMRQASRRSWRIGQTEPVKVVFMAYRNTLQADALTLVAKKLQSSLAVEGELPEDGLAVFGDDGDDLMLALARKIVAGEEEDGSVESVFEQARQVAAEAEALLVDEGWHAPEPAIVEADAVAAAATAPDSHDDAPEPQRTLFSWAEFMAREQDEPPKRRRRDEAPTLSLFEWALEREQEGSLAGAA